jgi:Fur family peroxide stress response transcriptional regulator
MLNSENLLRESGIKVTPQRLSIVDELYGRVHMSIDELYGAIKKRFPSISLATVYKNINELL